VDTRLRWTAADTVLVTLLTGLAGALRFAGITAPRAFVFDEFYASDACLYVLGPQALCRATSEISLVHPPLGKWLIGLGIRLFGFTPAGWRVAPLVAGTLSVAVLYVIARRLFGSRSAAALAAGLLAFDFLHFVMSRVAMLDIFVVFFGLLSFGCLLYDRDRGAPPPPAGGRASFHRWSERRWLFGAGLAGGAAVASKWSGLYLLAAVAVLAVLYGAARRAGPRRYRDVVREEGALLAVALVAVPAAVYVASYAGVLHGTLLTWPWAQRAWVQAFVARHRLMLEHHTGPLYVHPYASPAWSWLLLKRPVLFHFREFGGNYREILALGNPVVWWTGLVAIAATAWRLLRSRMIQGPETMVVAGFLAGYAPWFVIVRAESFLYYVLPAIPFLCLALAAVVARLSTRTLRAAAVAGLAAASIAMFAFFRPVLTGSLLPYAAWETRIVFRDCGPEAAGVPMRPVNRPVPSPRGWCWL
jgi:dolichyl-phosphate-mannose-protein mannosyltransferase